MARTPGGVTVNAKLQTPVSPDVGVGNADGVAARTELTRRRHQTHMKRQLQSNGVRRRSTWNFLMFFLFLLLFLAILRPDRDFVTRFSVNDSRRRSRNARGLFATW
jgi:hypothetical protein